MTLLYAKPILENSKMYHALKSTINIISIFEALIKGNIVERNFLGESYIVIVV